MKVPTCGLLATEPSYVVPQNLIWDQRTMDWLLKVKGITSNLPQCQSLRGMASAPKMPSADSQDEGPQDALLGHMTFYS